MDVVSAIYIDLSNLWRPLISPKNKLSFKPQDTDWKHIMESDALKQSLKTDVCVLRVGNEN